MISFKIINIPCSNASLRPGNDEWWSRCAVICSAAASWCRWRDERAARLPEHALSLATLLNDKSGSYSMSTSVCSQLNRHKQHNSSKQSQQKNEWLHPNAIGFNAAVADVYYVYVFNFLRNMSVRLNSMVFIWAWAFGVRGRIRNGTGDSSVPNCVLIG